uniref:Potassium channel toxin-like Tx677 n=1 Tax=Buthus israelis TaxID=2899555 RepID=KAX_BUTIS|nr:RecName: Full=Potassium channel toxin-like Tx677; AltName: Full=Potassium channel toxin alpha-KTx; Flags: Precursor [Buthus occitanus israelis]ACJ23147.1 putative potassium channel toxin Tx677 [Buthus occitanus israelis]
MKISALVMITLLICSMMILCQGQKILSNRCNNSSECIPHCIRIFGTRAAKCINRKCYCYP